MHFHLRARIFSPACVRFTVHASCTLGVTTAVCTILTDSRTCCVTATTCRFSHLLHHLPSLPQRYAACLPAEQMEQKCCVPQICVTDALPFSYERHRSLFLRRFIYVSACRLHFSRRAFYRSFFPANFDFLCQPAYSSLLFMFIDCISAFHFRCWSHVSSPHIDFLLRSPAGSFYLFVVSTDG